MNGFETILPFLKPIEHLILDDSVSEIMVNGPDSVFIEKAGYLQPVSGVSLGERALLVAVKNIARRLGGDISESHPILDSRLPDGSRVAVVIPPCSLNGVTLTIRKFNARHFEIQEAFDLLQLLNTGHAGTLSTIHANSARQGLARFTSCVLQSGVELPYRAIKSNIGDSLHVVIQIERRPGRRYISEVIEINNYDPDADLFDYCAIYQRQEAHA